MAATENEYKVSQRSQKGAWGHQHFKAESAKERERETPSSGRATSPTKEQVPRRRKRPRDLTCLLFNVRAERG